MCLELQSAFRILFIVKKFPLFSLPRSSSYSHNTHLCFSFSWLFSGHWSSVLNTNCNFSLGSMTSLIWFSFTVFHKRFYRKTFFHGGFVFLWQFNEAQYYSVWNLWYFVDLLRTCYLSLIINPSIAHQVIFALLKTEWLTKFSSKW